MKNIVQFLLFLSPLSILAQTRRDFTFKFDGVDRTFIVVKPTGATPVGGYPVVFMLHGTSGDGEKFYTTSGWKEKGEAEKFITVFPSSLSYCILNFPNNNPVVTTRWNTGDLQDDKCPNVQQTFRDDVKLLRKIVDTIKLNYTVNAKKVFASGFSNGCSMIHKLAIEAPDVFAAVAGASSILMLLDSAKPSRKIPIWNIVGANDDRFTTPYGASPLPFGGDSILRVLGSYINRVQGCEGLTNTFTKTSNAFSNTYTYRTPKTGEAPTTFVFTLIRGMAHVYPNGDNLPFAAADYFWDFFKQAVATDVKELYLPETAVTIYPNPSHDEMTIKMLENTDGTSLNNREGGSYNTLIFNMLGQQVFSFKNINAPQWTLKKEDIGRGIFMVKINQGEKTITKRVVFE
jgi:polyhydroxybutyrate depolymerase